MPEIIESTAHSQEGNWFSLAASLQALKSIHRTTEASIGRSLWRGELGLERQLLILLLCRRRALAPHPYPKHSMQH